MSKHVSPALARRKLRQYEISNHIIIGSLGLYIILVTLKSVIPCKKHQISEYTYFLHDKTFYAIRLPFEDDLRLARLSITRFYLFFYLKRIVYVLYIVDLLK